jgi:hypothetical protein
VLAHNKTLAAQLYSEFKSFFPENAVHYFVSYYDYYQPEAYIPSSDTYIEKDASVNERIERLRLAATKALIERRDVVVVASVSCIYGLGERQNYEDVIFRFCVGESYELRSFMEKLIANYYTFCRHCVIYWKIINDSNRETLQIDLMRLGEGGDDININLGKSKAVKFTRAWVKDPLNYYFGDQRIPEASS